MTSVCDSPLTRIQAITLSQERRGRSIPLVMVGGLLAIPITLVTFVIPLTAGAELWYVFVMDALLVGGFIVWRLFAASRAALRRMRNQPNIDRLTGGDTMIHWRYNADEIAQFAAQEYRRDRCISRAYMPLLQTALTAFIFGGLAGGMMLLVNATESSPGRKAAIPPEIIVGTAAFAFLLPMLVMVFQHLSMYLNDRKAKRQREAADEIRLNAQGVDGAPAGYMEFPAKSTRFHVEKDGQPVLVISVTQMSHYRGRPYPRNTVERILIPRGREAEAETLTHRR